MTEDALEQVAGQLRHEHRQYANGEDRPLGSYVVTAATYTAGLAAMGLLVRSSDRELPERYELRDLALLALGTHKLSRILAKDPVTSPLRAPFTAFAGQSGPSEVAEEVRGTGLRHAIGELVTCPFCLGLWIATAGMLGLAVAPRTTRFLTSVFGVQAGSDFLQLLYTAAQQRA